MAERPDAVETAPLDVAIRALRFRDRTAAELEARLEQRGVGETERAQALETLERIGYVDDERFARTRAEQLAERGSGDALIRDDLERRGLATEVIELAVEALEPERERATRIADARGRTVKTARYLASKGFGEETLEGLVAMEE
jgi:SOS response regulatory protein OraA/RecX